MNTEPVIPVPPMNVAVAQALDCSITDNDLQTIYAEIMDDLRSEKKLIYY